jgi:hypothetical protein
MARPQCDTPLVTNVSPINAIMVIKIWQFPQIVANSGPLLHGKSFIEVEIKEQTMTIYQNWVDFAFYSKELRL